MPQTAAVYPLTIHCLYSSRCIIASNSAENGGAIQTRNSTISMDQCMVFDNSANFLGGAMHGYQTAVNLHETVMELNASLECGGGIFADRSYVMLNDCRIASNTTQSEGGGVWIYHSNFDIKYTIFDENTAFEDNSKGGGLYCSESEFQLQNSVIRYNEAEIGGGLYFTNNSLPTVFDCIISSNLALKGQGGIYSYKRLYSSDSGNHYS